eukprot:jgi/Mesvir1/12299/Mv00501-RA.1
MAIDPARVVKPNPVPQDLICAICTGVLLDPVDGPCQHLACRHCLNDWLSKSGNKTCPSCRQPLTNDMIAQAHRVIRNQLDEFEVACDNAARGCTAVINLKALQSHVSTCGKGIELCQHDGCTATILRQDLLNHLQACAHRIIPCLCCNANIKYQDLREHLDHACPAMQVACQHNGGCGQTVQRDAMTTHINTECSRATIACVVPGCKKQVTRGAMKDHLDDYLAEHVMSLSLVVTSLQEANKTLEAEVAVLRGAPAVSASSLCTQSASRRADGNLGTESAALRGSQGGPSSSQPTPGFGQARLPERVPGSMFQCITSLRGHKKLVTKLVAADGRLYSAGQGGIRVWSLADHTHEETIHGRFNSVADIAVVGGVLYAVCQRKRLALKAWRTADNQQVDVPRSLLGTPVKAIAADKTGGRVLCAMQNGRLAVWSTSTFRILRNITCCRDYRDTYESALALGNSMLYRSAGSKIEVWNTYAYARHAVISTESKTLCYLSLTAGDRFLLAGTNDGSIKMGKHDNQSVKELRVSEDVYPLDPRLMVMDKDRLYTASRGNVQVWPTSVPARGAVDAVPEIINCEEGSLTALAVGNGMLYCAAIDRKIRVFSTGAVHWRIAVVAEPQKTSIYLSLAAGGGLLFAGGDDGIIKIWRASDNYKLEAELREHKSAVSALLVHDGKLYSGSEDGEIKVWQIRSA